jgi:2-dehydro-3-deoxyphosphogalactonate aldolase
VAALEIAWRNDVSALWQRVLKEMPLIAILRGMQPSEALDIAAALKRAGFLSLEVPLNSPDPFSSIRLLKEKFGGQMLIGAGTVLSTSDVDACHTAGAEFIVSPNTNADVIRATKAHGLLSLPGFMTPSEAFAALHAGADGLKLFPAEGAPPSVLRAMKAVLPKASPVFAVGGITAASMADYHAAGAAGFGIGSAIYAPGISADAVHDRAAKFVTAWRGLAP